MSAEPMIEAVPADDSGNNNTTTTRIYPNFPTDDNTLDYVLGSPDGKLEAFIRKFSEHEYREFFIKGLCGVSKAGDVHAIVNSLRHFFDELNRIRERYGGFDMYTVKMYYLAPKAPKKFNPDMMRKRGLVFPLGVWADMGDWRVEGTIRMISTHIEISGVNFPWSNMDKTPINMRLTDFIQEKDYPFIPSEILNMLIGGREQFFQRVIKPALCHVYPPNPGHCKEDMAKYEATTATLTREYLARLKTVLEEYAANPSSSAAPTFEPVSDFMVKQYAPEQLKDAAVEVNRYISRIYAGAETKKAKEAGRMTIMAHCMFNDDLMNGKRSIAHGTPIPLGHMTSMLSSCMLSDRKEYRLGCNVIAQAIMYLASALTSEAFYDMFVCLGRFAFIRETAVHIVNGDHYVPDRYFGTLTLGNWLGPVQTIEMLDESGNPATEEFNAMGHGYAIARSVLIGSAPLGDGVDVAFHLGLCGLKAPAIDPMSGGIDKAAVSHAITTLIGRLFTPITSP
jgi:hypothetical protein